MYRIDQIINYLIKMFWHTYLNAPCPNQLENFPFYATAPQIAITCLDQLLSLLAPLFSLYQGTAFITNIYTLKDCDQNSKWGLISLQVGDDVLPSTITMILNRTLRDSWFGMLCVRTSILFEFGQLVKWVIGQIKW